MQDNTPVTYIAPILDTSGYSEASRNYIAALLSVGVSVSIEPISFEIEPAPLGRIGSLLVEHIRRDIPTKINMLHMTPENYPRFLDKDKYNIGLTTWETSRLPDSWVPLINQLDEVWVPCEYNVENFKESGVTKPIFKFPHTINIEYLSASEEASTQKSISVPDDTFLFYSIFQWLPRKNPLGLIAAYLTEFNQDDKVCLVIKTYKQISSSHNLGEDKNWLRHQIFSIKDGLHLSYYPPIKLIAIPLSRDEILALHQRGDCFVLISRSEGFSLTHFESMCLGKPTIGTNYGGNLEFMNKTNSLLVDCTETIVSGMPWPIYTGKQNWSEPSILDFRKKMRWVYENKEEARLLGERAQQDILGKYSWQNIGRKMQERLKEISGNTTND